MKLAVIAILAVMSFSSLADSLTCREQMEDKLDFRNVLGGSATVLAGIPAGSMLMGAAAAGPAVFPIAAGVTLAGGTYWFISTRKPKKLIKLIDQAQSCKGKILGKAYRVYEKNHDSNDRLTKEEFCSAIVNGDRDGSLCAANSVPSIKDIAKYYID